jgi:hypothetical protein
VELHAYHQNLHERVLHEFAGIDDEELAAPSTFGALAEAEGAAIGARDLGTELWAETAKIILARADEIASSLAQ